MPSLTDPYCGPAPVPSGLWTAWNLDPALLAALVAMLFLLPRAESRRAFLIGWGVLVLAFVSPLCAMTVALFSARAVHHLLLLVVAAPLLAMALPMRRAGAAPAAAATALALVLWHLPVVYAAAWQNAGVYWLMQAALFLPAWAFWSVILGDAGDAGRVFSAAGLIAGLAGVMGLIGAVLVFATGILFPQHMGLTHAFGLEPMADQQLAGLIMWVPGFLPMAAFAALVAQRGWQLGQGR